MTNRLAAATANYQIELERARLVDYEPLPEMDENDKVYEDFYKAKRELDLAFLEATIA